MPTGTAKQRKRTPTPRGQGELTREKLLLATDELLRETRDTAALTIRGVTRRADVSAMTFYLHFTDRNELLVAVIERHFQRFLEALRDGLEAAPDGAARLRRMALNYVRFGLGRPGEYSVVFETAAQMPPGPPAPGASEAFDFLVDAVRAANPSDPEPRTTGVQLWSALHGTVLLRHNRPSFRWPDLEPTVLDLVDRLVPAS